MDVMCHINSKAQVQFNIVESWNLLISEWEFCRGDNNMLCPISYLKRLEIITECNK